ncbi:MAG: SDR family oxidoreductase [Candidatus Fervidibacter sp.]|uniref:SDR family oxidoreductase n=1 Tax=Candidatus Fervidibacter sp. TaxID=3100871 RepID=UPI00404A3704
MSEWKGVSVLVTGGAGFIGSHLVDKLVQLGAKVKVLDDFSTGKRENIAHLLGGKLRLIEGSLTDAETVKRAVEGVEVVFHQGALPSVARSVEDPLTTHQVNSTGTLLLLLASRDAGVRRVVFASSSSVYGDMPTLPKREDMTPNPKSPYALSKLVGEHLCRLFWELYGLETVSLRYFNIFGPRQDPASQYAAVIPRFVTALLKGERPVIYGDGEQTRDFTFVENCVQANLLAATKPNVAGEVFNVGAGVQTSVNDLFRLIRSLIGADEVEPIYVPPRPGDVRHSLAEITKAERLLGYKPVISLEEGLKLTIDWFRNRW